MSPPNQVGEVINLNIVVQEDEEEVELSHRSYITDHRAAVVIVCHFRRISKKKKGTGEEEN